MPNHLITPRQMAEDFVEIVNRNAKAAVDKLCPPGSKAEKKAMATYGFTTRQQLIDRTAAECANAIGGMMFNS